MIDFDSKCLVESSASAVVVLVPLLVESIERKCRELSTTETPT
jgi:hypothetical protein